MIQNVIIKYDYKLFMVYFLSGNASGPKVIQARNVSPMFTTPDQLLQRELSSPQSLSSRRGFMSGRGKGQESQTSFNKIKQRGRVSRWSQTIDGIRVYGSVITTNSDKFGKCQS